MQISPPYYPRSDKYSDTSVLFSPLWPLCHSPGPNSAYNEVPLGNWEQSLASKAAFVGKHEGWGKVWGAALGAEPHTVQVARLAPWLWSEQSRTLETVPLGFTEKMNGRKQVVCKRE